MANAKLILPRPDSRCGKVFYDDRRAAEGHRIALDFWNRATGRGREGYHLAVYRCKRCGGFHIGQIRIEKLRKRTGSRGFSPAENQDRLSQSQPDPEVHLGPGLSHLDGCRV
jgi:hypothetical protein